MERERRGQRERERDGGKQEGKGKVTEKCTVKRQKEEIIEGREKKDVRKKRRKRSNSHR